MNVPWSGAAMRLAERPRAVCWATLRISLSGSELSAERPCAPVSQSVPEYCTGHALDPNLSPSWNPFPLLIQVRTDDDVMVIDSRCGEDFAVYRPPGENGSSAIAPQFDACASWWTQVLLL